MMKPGPTGNAGASPSTTTKRPLGRRRRRLRKAIVALSTISVLGMVGGGLFYWQRRTEQYRPGEAIAEITTKLARSRPEGAPEIRFVDVTAEAGLGAFGSFAGVRTSQLPEDMGSGAAWGDFDNDGDDDLFLVSNGGPLDAPNSDLAPCALFENLGDGTFRAAPDAPELHIIGMAAAWGDADGDGWLDLIVTGYNTLQLFHNEQGRLVRDDRFEEIPGYWAGASWGDFDNDRALDLYVSGYVQYVEEEADTARASQQFGTAVPYTLNPSSYKPQRNLLFHNNGDGTFREIAEQAGVLNLEGRSLGAIWHDVDQDGRLDLYVANDVSDNVLYLNAGDRFQEISHAVYVADYRGAMGLAVGDYDRDGDDDIFVTHWVAQENALYGSLLADFRDMPQEPPPTASDAIGQREHTPQGLRYMDIADMKGLGQIALQMVGWGAEFADFDADGWPDLVVANGSTFQMADDSRRLKPQRSFLFWNRHGDHFHDLGGGSAAFTTPRVSRGLALSDYDDDGDLDILFVNHGEGALLLRNDMQIGHWLQVRLRSRQRDGQATGFGDGTTVIVRLGDAALRRSVTSTSYLSQSTRTLHFGLGEADRIDRLEVQWLGGETATFDNLKADALWEITEGDPAPRLIRRGGASAGSAGSAELTEKQRVVKFWENHRAAMHAMKVDNDCEKAIGLFRAALALDPVHEDARYYLGNCLAALGDTEAAIEQLTEMIRVNPRTHRGLRRLGVLRATSAQSPDDLLDARALLSRALEINKEETGVLLAMGEVDLMLGESDVAEQHLKWACQTNPRAVSGFYLRGYIAWKRGDDAGARELLAGALEARGEEWKPEGTTAEGDVARQMHAESTPLLEYWMQWDGALEPGQAFGPLDEFLKHRP